MNLEAGDIYKTKEEIDAAILRGERIGYVSSRVAKAVTKGLAQMTYEESKAYWRKRNKSKGKKKG